MNKNKLLVYFWIGLFLCMMCADLWIKKSVAAQIPLISSSPPFFPYYGIPLFYDFFGIDASINYSVNTGAAWGSFAGAKWLPYLRIVLIGVIGRVAYTTKDLLSKCCLIGVGIGALGNLIDWFLKSHVVDFIQLNIFGYFFPMFNLSDMMIAICGSILFLKSCQKSKCKTQSSNQAESKL